MGYRAKIKLAMNHRQEKISNIYQLLIIEPLTEKPGNDSVLVLGEQENKEFVFSFIDL